MSRPTKAQQVAKKAAEAERFARITSGRVMVLLHEGLRYCSSDCILHAHGKVRSGTLSRDDVEDFDLRIVRFGRWPRSTSS